MPPQTMPAKPKLKSKPSASRVIFSKPTYPNPKKFNDSFLKS